MSSSIMLTIKSDKTQAENQQYLQLATNQDQKGCLALASLFKQIAEQRHRAIVDVQTGAVAPVAASGTLTLVSVIATDACTIGSETFTFSSTPSGENQVEVDGADDTADALALATAINAHSVCSQIVVASSALGVVTITALQKGVVGNFINLSSADATMTASAANLEGGLGGITEAATVYTMGIA